ncbi:Hsp70 family protein [Dactylosporangium fulvum]|uniref:Hsp70 family protein n=1 Tax=Dactylosporangium fulvum TaxID=53359 RepID=A0ABY5W4W5_9ACTN|nr:Hsp70 family protein [Dactylosporangium fulvum]UWP85030.1 Hsp70 family protein [Dactylosporangium fulvum]
MAGRFRFAVDLGTSNTVAVVDRGDGSPRPLLFDGSPLLPSAVFADVSGAVYVGRDAERHMMTDAARFEPNPKGRVDDGVLLLGDREVPVVDLFAAVLRRVAAEAAQTGVPVAGSTVLTCPVDWGARRRAVLSEAAARAGLGAVTLLDEPVAAATYCVRAFGGPPPPGTCVVVFDFGGGTLDVTVVEAAPDGLRVLATGGLDDLGGTDVDAALVGHLGHLVAAADPALWHRLAQPRTAAEYRDRRVFWSEVRAAKEMLARSSSAPVHVPGRDQATHLTREELDRIAGPLVDRAVDETRRVLHRSGVPADRLAAIVLVGGSSRLPLVASRLHARFGLAPVVPEQPELPVAFGALLLANASPLSSSAPSADTAPAPRPAASPADPASGGFPTAPASGGFPAGPVSAYPASPVSGYPGGPASAYPDALSSAYPGAPGSAQPAAAPTSGQPGTAPTSGQPASPPRRPAVVIGPGVTIQGNVAIYGDDDLMPPDKDEDDEPGPRDKPEPPRRRRGGALRRLRFLMLPLIPMILIMALTPWGKGLLADGRSAVERLIEAGPSVSPSASAAPQPSPSLPLQASAELKPNSGRAGTRAHLVARDFQPGEEVLVARAATADLLTTLTAGPDGSLSATVTPAASGTKAGPVDLQLVGRRSGRIAQASFEVRA